MLGVITETAIEETTTPTMALMEAMTMDLKQTNTKTRIGNQKVLV